MIPFAVCLAVSLSQAKVSLLQHKFHVGYSDGNGWRDGLWGWMIDRSCGPPHNFTQACTETTNISAPSKVVMLSRFAATVHLANL